MTDYLPPRHSDADRLADAWRYALADADHAAIYLLQARRLELITSIGIYSRNYLRAVRAASTYEERMTAAGIPFNRSRS